MRLDERAREVMNEVLRCQNNIRGGYDVSTAPSEIILAALRDVERETLEQAASELDRYKNGLIHLRECADRVLKESELIDWAHENTCHCGLCLLRHAMSCTGGLVR